MCESADWIQVAQKSDLTGAIVKTRMKYPVSKKGSEFLDTCMAAMNDCGQWT